MNRLSIVLPVRNEADSLEKVYASLSAILLHLEMPYEIIFVNDGSDDDSPDILKTIKDNDPSVKVVNLDRSYGQSSALQAGFDHAGGDTIITLDADLENDPRDIVALLDRIIDGYDVINGRRVGRPFKLKNVLSGFGNLVFKLFFGAPVSDMACTLRAYKKEALDKIVIRGSLHRYLPILLYLVGAKVTEVPVGYAPRKYGRSKYGILPRSLTTLRDLYYILFWRDEVLNDKSRDYKVASVW